MSETDGLPSATKVGGARKRGDDLHQRHAEIMKQQDRLLNLRLLEEIDATAYAQKATEVRDDETHLSLRQS